VGVQYTYKCPRHGAFDHHQRGDASACPACGESSRRVWLVPGLIVRPWGWSLRPGDRDYWNVGRTAEVSRIPAPDANSNLGAGAPSDEELEADEYAGVPFPQPSEDGMQKLHEVARATLLGNSGSRL
jgi:hypothetical protein